MHSLLTLLLCILVVQFSVAPPVTKNDDGAHKDKENKIEEKEEMENAMEYHRYLKEVVQALESDPQFRAKLEKAEESDILTGKIAHELEFVSHKVRSKLDELKREELERLRHLATQENQLNNGLDLQHLKIAQHIDHSNSHTFEVNDLKRLIAKITEDLAEADKRRHQQFKEYEMKKKYEQEQKMKSMNAEEKKKYVQELQEMREKHKQHEPLHHPGSKQQLEEVWEKQDHMDSQDFDPKKFFYYHDIDGNGVWDQNEVKALFLKELDKLYSEGAPEDDLVEREEEMERMREHVFNEADLNKDGLISYDEFLEQTKKPDFQQDAGWEALDEQQIYSPEEYDAYVKLRQQQIQAMIARGIQPPQELYDELQRAQQFPPAQRGDTPVPANIAAHQLPPQQYHSYQGQPVQQQLHPQQVPIQQQYQGQVVGQQQVPVQHQQQQVPVQHQQQQVPVQHQQQQVPVQHQQQQVPVQHQQQQVPVQHQQQQVPVQHQQQQHVSVQQQQQQQVPIQQQPQQVPIQQQHVSVQQQHQQQANAQIPPQQQQYQAQMMQQAGQHISNQIIPNQAAHLNQQAASNTVQQEIHQNSIHNAGAA